MNSKTAEASDMQVPARQVGKKGMKARADLMAAARSVFSRLGYTNTRVQDITIEANFSLGAFYRYFKDKEDILKSLISVYFEQAYSTTFLGARYDPVDPTNSLYRSTMQTVNFAVDNRDLMRILWETSQIDPEIERQWDELRGQLGRKITRLIERAQQDKISYTDLDPASTAELLIGMTEHVVYRRLVRPASFAADEPARLTLRLTQLWAHALFIPEFSRTIVEGKFG